MAQYRYRTAAMVGRWRDTRQQAEADAVEHGLAAYTTPKRRFVRWVVAGDIEEK